MSNENIPDHYRIPPGAKDILGAIHPSTPHMLASAIEYLFRAGRKPGNPMAQDVRKAANMIGRWLETIPAVDASVERPASPPDYDRIMRAIHSVWVISLTEDGNGYVGEFQDAQAPRDSPVLKLRSGTLHGLFVAASAHCVAENIAFMSRQTGQDWPNADALAADAVVVTEDRDE